MDDDDISFGNDNNLSNDECKSRELITPAHSDEENNEEACYGKFMTFYRPKTMTDFKWKVRTYFADKQDILDAIKTYTLENCRNIKFVKNDKRIIRLKCVGVKGQCPWMAYHGYLEVVDT